MRNASLYLAKVGDYSPKVAKRLVIAPGYDGAQWLCNALPGN